MIDWFTDKFRWMLLIGLIGIVYLCRLTYADYHAPLFDIHSRVVTQEPYANDRAILEYKRLTEVLKSCPFDVERYIIDSAGFRHDLATEYDYDPRPLGNVSGALTIDLPDYLPSGPAVYRSYIHPKCDFLQRWFDPKQALPPLEFVVRRDK